MGRAEQLERRRRRGRAESYEIEAQGEHPVWSAFRVKGPSGRSYKVRLWNLEAGIHQCSCPDFATNALGTCKHVEAVLHHLRETQAEALEAARAEDGPPVLVYLDAAASPPEVRLRTGPGADPATVEAAQRLFDKKGTLPEEKFADLEALLEGAEAGALTVTPAAEAYVAERLARATLIAGSADAEAAFDAWSQALEARQQRK